VQFKLAATKQQNKFDQIKQKNVQKMGSLTLSFFCSVYSPCCI